MRDEIRYSVEMFEVIEQCVRDYKEVWHMEYFEALERIIQVSAPRQLMFGMNDRTAEYDMSNIIATFNIIWGE